MKINNTKSTCIYEKRYTVEDFKKEYISSDYEGLFNNLIGKRFILLEGHTGIGKSHLAECLAKLIVGYDDTEGHHITTLWYGSNTADYLIKKCKGEKPRAVIIDGINLSELDFMNVNDVPDNVYIICTTLGNQKPIEMNGLERFYRYTPENILGTEELENYIKEKYKNKEIIENVLSFLEIIKDTDISMRWLEEIERICENGEDSTEIFNLLIVEQTKIKCELLGLKEVGDKLQALMVN